MNAMIVRAGLAGLVVVLLSAGAWAQPVTHARLDKSLDRFVVARDLTYVETSEQDTTLLTQRGLRAGERAAFSFYPDKQALEVVEAWVDQPDGSRVVVPPGSIFTRPSAASQSAPGFTGSLTTTVLFPQLREGSRTHVLWRRAQKVPPLLGVNVMNQALLEWATGEDATEIEIPADLPFHWRSRGNFAVQEHVADGIRRIRASIHDLPAQEAERNSVSSSDYQPMFLATTQPNLEAIGALYYRQSQDRVAVTPEIAALAARIVGDRTGREAARAIHEWITGNIRYVAVYLNPDDGWVPHAAAEVLHNGYGDCKDHVALMQALLAARGIESYAAIVDWGARTTDLPLWMPGQFNHAIIYLPAFDHYANPTDHYAGFDALDRRLSGKTVVLATPEGRVARTPAARPEQNSYHLVSQFTIDADGTIDASARLTLSPNAEIGLRSALANASSLRELAERILSGTAEGGVGTIAASNPRDLSRPLDLSARWQARNGVTFQGDTAYLRIPSGIDIDPPTRLRSKLSPNGHRKAPMLADIGEHVWETSIALPPGINAARLPSDVAVQTSAGSYTASYRREGTSLLVRRQLVIAHDVVAPADYPAFETLLAAPLADARAVVVLRRGDGE
jgi:transglutaminase-like putative cysteine protease